MVGIVESREAGHVLDAANPQRRADQPKQLPFVLLVIFLVIEYARPPLIYHLRLQMLVILLMPVFWLRSSNPPWSNILMAQILYLLWAVKSLPIASNWFAVYLGCRVLFGLVSISLGISWICSYRGSFRSIVWLWVAIMVYQALWAITHGGGGSGGMLGDENDLALACCMALPFAYFGFEQLRGPKRWLCLGAAAILVSAVVASFSRGGFVALVAVGAHCWFISSYKLRSLGVAIASALVLYAVAPDSYIAEIKSIPQTDSGTAEARRFLWTTAWDMFKDHPILGVGAGNAVFLIGTYQPTDFGGANYQQRNWSGSQPHSIYFQGLAEHGAPGMAIWASISWLHFRTLRRLRKRSDLPADVKRDVQLFAPALAGAMTAFLVAGIFLSVLYYPYFFYVSALSVALEAAVRREVDDSETAEASLLVNNSDEATNAIRGRERDVIRNS